MRRGEIVAAARAYIGAPYLHQGRSRSGIDCIGLIVCVARDLGLPVADAPNYTRDPEPDKLRGGLALHLISIAPADALPGDVALFRIHTEPQHTAILTDIGMIHSYASPSANRVVEHGMGNWCERMVGAYRFPGVTD